MTSVSYSGPLFDGRAEVAVERYVEEERQRLAQIAMDRIHTRLGEVIRHPTGRYESQIHTEMQADDLVVTDYPIVYGPWLEGVGSRNAPRTRFPGYHTFRIVFQDLDAQAGEIAERDLEPTIEAMNE